MMTAPETPKAQKELFLAQEESVRKREDLEHAAEEKRRRLLQQADDDRDDATRKLQGVLDGGVLSMGYNPTLPTGVQQLHQFQQGQDTRAGAIYRMGAPMKGVGGNLT